MRVMRRLELTPLEMIPLIPKLSSSNSTLIECAYHVPRQVLRLCPTVKDHAYLVPYLRVPPLGSLSRGRMEVLLTLIHRTVS